MVYTKNADARETTKGRKTRGRRTFVLEIITLTPQDVNFTSEQVELAADGVEGLGETSMGVLYLRGRACAWGPWLLVGALRLEVFVLMRRVSGGEGGEYEGGKCSQRILQPRTT